MAQTAAVRKTKNDLTEGNILASLLTFAVPIILTNIVQQLYSMVDLAIIGQSIGSVGSVAVSTGSEVADMMMPVASGFSMAGQIYIAQLYGARQQEKIKKSVGTLLGLCLIVPLACGVLAALFCRPILELMNCPAEALSQAESYMLITCIGFPFMFEYNAIIGVLRGMGESRRPLIFILISALVNIGADYLLVMVIPLQAAGTAIATVLAQFCACAAAFLYMLKYKEKFDFEPRLSYFKLDGESTAVLVKLAVPQIARSLMVRFSMMWVNAKVNSFGLTVSATNSIGNKIQKFLESFITGIDTACGAMIGQNLGARKIQRCRRIIWTTLACCEAVAVVLCFISLTFPRQIFRLMTTDEAVIKMGVRYLQIICFHFLISSFTATFQSMVTGCGFVSLGFVLGILDGVVCRIGISLFFYYVLNAGYESYWWGTAFARVLTGLVCFWYFLSNKWAHRKLLSEE